VKLVSYGLQPIQISSLMINQITGYFDRRHDPDGYARD
jgi:hypothetical protein